MGVMIQKQIGYNKAIWISLLKFITHVVVGVIAFFAIALYGFQTGTRLGLNLSVGRHANCYRKVCELRWPEGYGYGARFAVTSASSSKASIPPKSSVSDTSTSPAGATSTI